MSFLAEVQRRKVGRIALLYVVAGWLAIQVAATLFPLLHLPASWGTIVAIVALCGFPIALAIAWVFDFTPSGIHRTESLSGKPAFAFSILALAVITAGAIAGSYVIFDRSRVVTSDMRSIAVLPFTNMSARGDEEEYFADGVTEEISNELGNIAGLRVAARTSSFAFKGKNETIENVARQLGVRMVLHGSVRRDGENVLITAQLSDGVTGFSRWSKKFERSSASIFEVQAEIASAIAREMRLELNEQSSKASRSTSVDAHDLFLLGLSKFNARTKQSLHEALTYFQRAVDADPAYAEAHGLIAMTWSVLPLYDPSLDLRETAAKARAAAKAATALRADNAEAHAALAHTSLYLEWNFREAESEAREAIRIRPGWATAHQFLAEALLAARRYEDGLAAIDHAIKLDPLSPAARNVRTAALRALSRYDEAVASARETVRLYPSFPLGSTALINTLTMAKRYDEVLAVLDSLPTLRPQEKGLYAALAKGAKRYEQKDTNHPDYRMAIGVLTQAEPVAPLAVGASFALLGRDDDAARALTFAFERHRDPGMVNVGPFLSHLTDDQRLYRIWEAMMNGRATLR